MADNVLNTNVSPVHWATASSTNAPQQDGRGDRKLKKPKPSRSEAKSDQDEGTAAKGPEPPHELDSFA